MLRLAYARLIRRERGGGLDEEARIVLRWFDERSGAHPLLCLLQKVADPAVDLLLLELAARGRNERRLLTLWRGAIEHREGMADVAACGRGSRLCQQCPLAFLRELRGQEGDTQIAG